MKERLSFKKLFDSFIRPDFCVKYDSKRLHYNEKNLSSKKQKIIENTNEDCIIENDWNKSIVIEKINNPNDYFSLLNIKKKATC